MTKEMFRREKKNYKDEMKTIKNSEKILNKWNECVLKSLLFIANKIDT